MRIEQINELIATTQKNQTREIELIETHISWVLLCDEFVYKIKKPVQFDFLDFSTLSLRKHFCDQEIKLNRRLTENIYLNVCEIYSIGKNINVIGNKAKSNGKIIDYCVKMKRLDNHRLMRNLLKKQLIKPLHIQKIVDQLINFHLNTQIVHGTVNPQILWSDFNNLRQVDSFINHHLESNNAAFLTETYSFVERFINNLATRIYERDLNGFSRDCHGDLHSGNIFLLDEPIIFDCIEFNDHFRQIDILNELAFFCTDLTYYHQPELSKFFIKKYTEVFPVIENKLDEALFLFYKLYRSNVKVKVNAIKCMQARSPEIYSIRFRIFKGYLDLMQHYATLFKQEVIF